MPEPTLTALVIGNAAYQNVPVLENPVNDAEDMSAKLEDLGFTVETLRNATVAEMQQALLRFASALVGSSVGLLFFAGHAFQIDGLNFLAAVDTSVSSEYAVSITAVNLASVLGAMRSAAVRTGLVILDACRDNPFEGVASRSAASSELAPVFAPKGTLIAFSTSPGQRAGDGRGLRNGYYTQALLQHIDTPNILIETMFKRVRSSLEAITNGRQTSWEHTSLTGDFRFQRRHAPGISGYGPTALSDSLFPLQSNDAGRLIVALESVNWDTQNLAVQAFTSAQANSCTLDELFVIGRNIYQAACGASYGAIDFLDEFKHRTVEYESAKRKAVLDGMLYEIFFDSLGQYRTRLKSAEFSRVFELAGDEDFRNSLTFIGGCLLPYAEHFHVMPGRQDPLHITITALPADEIGRRSVTGIWLDSTNIYRELGDEEDGMFFGIYSRDGLDFRELREYLSRELVIPPNLLLIDAPNPHTAATMWVLPSNRTLSRA